MADKLLKSIKFPTLPDRYVIGDSTLTEEGAAADAKAVGDALATKADTSGTYEDLIVGGAEQLMSDEYETDKDPYLFRPTGGSADVGNREYVDKIVGGTVGWNQLVQNGNFADTSVWSAQGYGTLSANGNVGTFTISQASNSARIEQTMNPIKGHKYLAIASIKPNKAFDVIVSFGSTRAGAYITRQTMTANAWNYIFGVRNAVDSDLESNVFRVYPFLGTQTVEVGDTIQFRDIICTDLTALFNPTIADYIYSLEQSQAGDGVAWFRNYFQKDYYPYDPGTLRSVEGVSAHETVGFNQWDEEWELGRFDTTTGVNVASANQIRAKNYIPVIPNTTYYFNANPLIWVLFFDADKNAIPSGASTDYSRSGNSVNVGVGSDTFRETFTAPPNARYMRFYCVDLYGTTYNHDICINLSDPSRNGEYEPYTKHTYPLDSSLTLRGVPKLVDGKLAFDGDVYPPSGEVQRRYGLRAYQSGDESLADAITDGTNTVYKLATPTTETADGYEQYQICDPSGTEEYVTTGIVPVGHETRYPHDLKKKIETAPDSPSTDGTYLMKRSGGKNAYMALPSTPSANGAYVLTVTVSGGTASYSWTAKE